ncbi:hypothetical protein DSO57_1020792 [Entomophthora muscae]|uniref:Uncharacterized protein n=1 Tax=Entomophthora muscae TaxID=34485 RepID=A0ACC2SGX9_9FUNG|nr:hypothetical protein DSO57_1020792 [Entomophthora muscae]
MSLKFGSGWRVMRRAVTDPLMLMAMLVTCRVVANLGQISDELRRVGMTSHRLCVAYERVVKGVSLARVWDLCQELPWRGNDWVFEMTKFGIHAIKGSTIGAAMCIAEGRLAALVGAKEEVDKTIAYIDSGIDVAARKISDSVNRTLHFNSASYNHFRVAAKPPLCDQLAMEEAIAAVELVVRGIQYMAILGMLGAMLVCCLLLAGLDWSTSRRSKERSRRVRTLTWPINFLNYPNAHRCLLMGIFCLATLQIQRKAVQAALFSITEVFKDYVNDINQNILLHLEFTTKDLAHQANLIVDWFTKAWPIDAFDQVRTTFQTVDTFLPLIDCFLFNNIPHLTSLFSMASFAKLRNSPYEKWMAQWHQLIFNLLDPTHHIQPNLTQLETRLNQECFILAAMFLTAYAGFLLLAAVGTILNTLSLFTNPSLEPNQAGICPET